jgi:hypothetical protein
MLHAIKVLANIFSAINPLLFTLALLHIVFEFSSVSRAIDVSVFSVTVSHIILKFTSVYVALGVPEYACSFSFAINPVTFVMGTVDPILNPVAMPYFVFVVFAATVRRSNNIVSLTSILTIVFMITQLVLNRTF